jgi:hypothetical protein
MSVEATAATWKLQNVSTCEKLFLLSCADRASENGVCWPSIKRLCADTSSDRKTIIKVRQSVIDKGLLQYTGEMQGRTKSVPVMRLTYVQYRCESADEYKDEETSSPKNGTALDVSSRKNGTAKQSQKRDTEPKREEPKIKTKEKINKKEKSLDPKYKETYYPQPENTSKNLTIQTIQSFNPHNLPAQMIADWIENRRVKKSAITLTAWERINKELQKCPNPIAAFEEYVANGWIGFNVSWLEENKNKPKKSHFDNDSTKWADGIEKDMF